MAGLRRLGQQGYSLVELMFVVGIAGIAISSIVRFTFQSRMDLSRQEVATDLYNTNARIGSNLREDLQSAQFVLANYSGYNMTALMAVVRASATAGGAPAPVAFTMPPVVTTMNDPDLTGTAASTWGNELMYVAQLSPITFTVQDPVAWGGCTCTSSTLAVERYQFVYDYLTNANTAIIPDLGRSLRMVQWRSSPFIDLRSIDPANSGRSLMAVSETVATVMAMGYTTALDIFHTQAITTAFYTLVSPSSAPIYGTTPVTSLATLPQSSWAYMDDYDALQSFSARPNVNRRQISNSGGFGSVASPYTKSIAYNNTGTGSPKVNGLDSPGHMLSVPAYAQADLAVSGFGGGPGFPAGFEVAIMGPVSQRQVYIRRVIMSSSATKPGHASKTYMAHEAVDEISLQNFPY